MRSLQSVESLRPVEPLTSRRIGPGSMDERFVWARAGADAMTRTIVTDSR
jgi:hypothetical protein